MYNIEVHVSLISEVNMESSVREERSKLRRIIL